MQLGVLGGKLGWMSWGWPPAGTRLLRDAWLAPTAASPPPQDALAEGDKLTLEVARLIKDDFLQQNSYTKWAGSWGRLRALGCGCWRAPRCPAAAAAFCSQAAVAS